MPSLVQGSMMMNGHDFDRRPMNGLSYNFDGYSDDVSAREDMRREDDIYPRNVGRRFGDYNFDQTSLSEFRSNEPKFELDHLATFAAGTKNGCIHAEDGLRKLRQMENTTGIWTMRCVLIVERNYLIILDNTTGEELEKFPIMLVQDPTAIFKNDRREIYNNLILFTIVDDPKKRSVQADMHIFQSCKAPAQEIVDEILAAKGGQQRIYPGGSVMTIYNQNNSKQYRSRIPPPPMGPAPEPPSTAYDFQGMREYFDKQQQYDRRTVNQGRSFRVNKVRESEDLDGGSNAILERDVQLLNHCFDDIEKFVARLQQAAESFKELDRRKRDRGAKNKKRQSGDGMLNARARPPPDKDFIDIFQKFKLAFNLLAKLKAHIHDPNAPELVHFLFTPLSLIYEASRDPYHGNQNLADQAVAPVLTAEAKQLLMNCLTSKEIDLWQTLGQYWIKSRPEWNGGIPPYVPEFYDGWQPAASVIDELNTRSVVAQPIQDSIRNHIVDERRPYNQSMRPMPYPEEERPERMMRQTNHFDERLDQSQSFDRPSPRMLDISTRGYNDRGFDTSPMDRSPPLLPAGNSSYQDFVVQPQQPMDRSPRIDVNNRSPIDPNSEFLDELRHTKSKIYEAAHDRVGKNQKELTVKKGDILEVLDDSKNWWKLRNYRKEVGFAPYTILKAVRTDDDVVMNGGPPNRSNDFYLDYNYASRRATPGRGDVKYF